MKVNVAVTLPINPTAASPVLTQKQVWDGFKIKAANPMSFVPASHCEVLEDYGEKGIKRHVKFNSSGTPLPSEGTEVITYFEPMKADFHMLERQFDVSNIISIGENDELYMTFTFVTEAPGVQESSSEGADVLKFYRTMAKSVVQKTIDVTRELVVKGEI